MKPVAVAALVMLAACERPDPAAVDSRGGEGLERAALAANLITDPSRILPTGVFAADNDRVCLLPRQDGYRVGASVDYGEGQRCVARGTATGHDTLAIDFGEGCRFNARSDGDRIVFPTILPSSCAGACERRATLAALSVERLSDAEAEAARLRGADGRLLCAD